MYVVDGMGRKKRHVVGLAPVSGMCNSLNSCTISEGTSFQVILKSLLNPLFIRKTNKFY